MRGERTHLGLRKATACALLAFLAAGMASTLQAQAVPHDTKIAAVYQLPCSGSVCDADDSSVASNGQVHDAIEIRVSSESAIGLSELRLEVQAGSGPLVCLGRWDAAAARSFSARMTWTTSRFPSRPSGCASSSLYGQQASNGVYTFRLTATENTTGDRQPASFPVKVVNSPAIPVWAQEPQASGEEEGRPVITFSWHRNPEPDVVEYRYFRSDPYGSACASECQFAVSADDPEGQGCTLENDVYSCTDDYFASDDYTGEYSYSLVALRSSPAGTRCALPPQSTCVASERSEVRAATLEEPPPPPPPSPSTEPSASEPSPRVEPTKTRRAEPPSHFAGGVYGRQNNSVYIPGTFETTLPYGRRPVLVPRLLPGTPGRPGTPASELAAPEIDTPAADPRQLIVPVAAGLLLFLAAAHMARVLLRPVGPRSPRP